MDHPPAQAAPGRLIVFTRYSEPGKVKTRLIPAIGADAAATVHESLVRLTLGQVDAIILPGRVEAEIRFTGGTEELMRWKFGPRRYRPQGEGNLGDRMARAAADAFAEGCKQVVLIGTDCPDLMPRILEKAFDEMCAHDVVLGPALDGGYYLIGISREIASLFSEIPWGTADVFRMTMNRLESLGVRTALLPPLADIDRPEDLRLLAAVDQRPS